jgi:hypothetical protein
MKMTAGLSLLRQALVGLLKTTVQRAALDLLAGRIGDADGELLPGSGHSPAGCSTMMPEMLTAGEVVDGVPAAGRRWQEAGATSVCVALCVMDMNVSPLPPGVEVEGLLL